MVVGRGGDGGGTGRQVRVHARLTDHSWSRYSIARLPIWATTSSYPVMPCTSRRRSDNSTYQIGHDPIGIASTASYQAQDPIKHSISVGTARQHLPLSPKGLEIFHLICDLLALALLHVLLAQLEGALERREIVVDARLNAVRWMVQGGWCRITHTP